MSNRSEPAEPIHDRFFRTNARNLDNPFVGAFEVALRLGQWAIGSEHICSALLAGKPDDQAAEIMRSVGFDVEKFEAALRRRGDDRTTDRVREEFFRDRERRATHGLSLRVTPSFNCVDGLSQGFSSSRHSGAATSLDFLLAFMWSGPDSLWPYELDARDVTAEVVLQELVKRAIAPPAASLPKTVRAISIVKFPSDAVAAVIDVLNRNHPEESERCWRIEARSVDATIYADPSIGVDAALREAGAQQTERVV